MTKRGIILCAGIGSIVVIFVAIVGVLVCCFPIKFKAELIEFGQERGVNPVLIASVINAESRFDPNAKSQKGAVGLMQLLPSTAEEIAEKLGFDNFKAEDLLTPATNIRFGTYYLAQLIEQFGDTATALCAYNAGPATVKVWLSTPEYSTNGVTLTEIPFPETKKYVKKIAFYQKIYKFYF